MGTATNNTPSQEYDIKDACGPMAHASSIPMAAVDGGSHIVRYVNPAFCLLVSQSAEELIGRSLSAALTCNDECLSLFDRVYRTGQAETYTGRDESASASYRSYAMWPAVGADGGTLAIIVQVIEPSPAHDRTVAINQALMLSSVHQHERNEAAEALNAKLQMEVARRRHAEEELHASDIVARFDRDLRFVYANARIEKATGFPQKAMVGKTPRELMLPSPVVDIVTRALRSVLESDWPEVAELSFDSPDGSTHWEANFIPEFGENEAAESVLLVARDITEEKRLEQTAKSYANEVQALAASLITAQDEERRRVARELHDNIGQQLASLSVDIGMLLNKPPAAKETQRRLKSIQARVADASDLTTQLAHQMHPSTLENLGLAVALQNLCLHFSERHPEIALQFEERAAPAAIPREVASCLYRIAQESLQNVTKHSRAKHVSVALESDRAGISMTVADDGVGFDLSAARGRGGLGLVAMEERTRLVNGNLTVTAQPGHGTQISLHVPLP